MGTEVKAAPIHRAGMFAGLTVTGRTPTEPQYQALRRLAAVQFRRGEDGSNAEELAELIEIERRILSRPFSELAENYESFDRE